MTDDLRTHLADALNSLPESFWVDPEDVPTVLDVLLPVVEAHGRASAATALRQAADDRRMPRNGANICRTRAGALEARQ